VRLLLTSQEALHQPEEQRVPLGPLGVPPQATVDAAARAGAIELFAARACGADPRFVLGADNIGAVVDICRRLDGLPLAIELAAARVPLLGVEGLRARLDDRFRLLTAGSRLALRRHQTLRAALDWSFGLLTHDEQTVFRRLGVFAGGFGLESAQAVASDAAAEATIDRWAVLDHLGALVDKSLVVVDPGEAPRCRLLESGRAFALEQLHASGETNAVTQRHAAAMLDLFERAYEQQWSLPARELRARCLPELDNLRAALSWAETTAEAAECFIALAGSSSWLWQPAGLRPEGLVWCERAIVRVNAHTSPRASARLTLARALLTFPRVTAAEVDAVRRAVEFYRALGDRRGLYLALNALGQRQALMRDLAASQQSADAAAGLIDPNWPPALQWPLMRARAFWHGAAQQPREACALWQEMARQQEATGEFEGMTVSLMNAADQGYKVDFDAAVELARRVVEQMRCDRFRGLAAGFARANLFGALAQRDSDLDEALELAREAVPLLVQGDTLALFLDHYALLALRLGRGADAARVLGRSDATSPARGVAREAHEQRSHDAVLALLRDALPAAELVRLLGEGASLGDLDAARLALGEDVHASGVAVGTSTR
jgi:predicted ATPase